MYAARPGLLIGFHGCDESFRDQIINGRAEFRPSKAAHEWLGHGIYFWENNAARALQFATEQQQSPKSGKPHISKPAVLGAVLDLGHCLDLLDSAYLELVQLSFRSFSLGVVDNGGSLPTNKRPKGVSDALIRELDCAVMENLHQQHTGQPFDSVRAMFTEGPELYPGAGFHEKSHIQICVRNPNCIKGLFLPRKEVSWP